MRVEGEIYPKSTATNFTREAWCQFIKSRPEFHRAPPIQCPNPFKPGELMTIRAAPDVADVVVDGVSVGNVYYSMSDEPLVFVSIEPSAMRLVHEWVALLCGEFRPDSSKKD
jgi:hypothetical protein